MARNCYIQIREFGPDGWSKFLPTLFFSDRVDTWAPSGLDLARAYNTHKCPFSESDFIDLIERKLVRISARTSNVLKNSGQKTFFKAEDSLLGRYIGRLAEGQGDQNSIVLHDQYDSSEIAFTEIRSRDKDDLESHYAEARRLVNRHLNGDDCVAPVVFDRARQFSSMDIDDISDIHIREVLKYLRTDISSKDERDILSICFQLIRISLEHKYIMEKGGCQVHFAYSTYADGFRAVSKAAPFKRETRKPIGETVDSIFALINFLLEQEPVRGVGDFLSRYEKLAKYRETMWSISENSADIEKYVYGKLTGEKLDDLPVHYVFGKHPLDFLLNAGAYAYSLQELIAALIDGISLGDADPIALMAAPTVVIARTVWAKVLENSNQRETYPGYWPAVLVYNTERPSREQIKAIAKDLEYRIISRKQL
jgi:hypothetical protein